VLPDSPSSSKIFWHFVGFKAARRNAPGLVLGGYSRIADFYDFILRQIFETCEPLILQSCDFVSKLTLYETRRADLDPEWRRKSPPCLCLKTLLADPGPGESLLAWGSADAALPSARVVSLKPRLIEPQPSLARSPALVHSEAASSSRPSWIADRAPRTAGEHQEYSAFLASSMRRYASAESRRLTASGAADDLVKVRPQLSCLPR
jgi:hypothetical protein